MELAVYKKVLRISAPIIGTSLASIFANIIGMIFVARLGHVQLAAGALASSTYIALLVLATGSMYAVSILIAGTTREDITIRKCIFHSAIVVGFCLIIPIAVFFYFCGFIFQCFHQPQALIDIAVGYFHIMIFALPLIVLYMVLQQYFIGTERPSINLKITMLSLISTTVLSYIFILGKLAFPVLGLKGLAWAQLISLVFICGLYSYYLIKKGDQQKYQLMTWQLQANVNTCWKIVKIGLPIGIQYGAELAAMTIATYFIGWIGIKVLAAAQISSQISMLAVMVFLGLSQGTAVLISQAMSQKRIKDCIIYNKAANILGVSLMLLVTAILVCFPEYLIHFYVNVHDINNQFIIHQAKILLAVSGLVLTVDAVRNITAGALRGIHDSKTPMWWGILCQWFIALPMAYLLGFTLHYGAGGIRFGFVIGFGLCAAILVFRFRSKMLAQVGQAS